MRLTREYVFDLIELVGKAVVTARKKAASRAWDMDGQLDGFVRRWSLDTEDLDRRIRESAGLRQGWGLFGGSTWRDSSDDGQDGSIDDRAASTPWSPWGGEAFEQRRAQRNYDSHGDSFACSLWRLQRQLQFKEVGVLEALKDLQEICSTVGRGFISQGWGNRLAAIVDQTSR